jgi:hypothetical protein
MVGSRRFPGSSCCERYKRGNDAQREIFLNRSLSSNSEAGGEYSERCPEVSLSEIIDSLFFGKGTCQIRGIDGLPFDRSGKDGRFPISLVKIDAEGAELEILQSISSVEHWDMIEQVVVETAACFCELCFGSEGLERKAVALAHEDNLKLFAIEKMLTEKLFTVKVDYNAWGSQVKTGNVLIYAKKICRS